MPSSARRRAHVAVVAAMEPLSPKRRVRVPVVLQQDPTECAAACLAMILRAHGRATTLDECRADCGSGRDGATAESIVRAARSRGMVARGFSADVGALGSVPLPAVLHWELGHFVVLERLDGARCELVDPAVGRRRLTLDELRAGFSGVVLAFEPGPTFERRTRAEHFRWGAYVRGLVTAPGVRSGLAKIVLASVVLQALGLVLPLFTKVVIDDVLPDKQLDLLPTLCAAAFAWVAAQACFGYLRSRVLLNVRTRLDEHVMGAFFAHLLALPFRWFQTRTTGDLLTRLSSNAVLRELLTAQAISVAFDGLLVGAYLVMLAFVAPVVAAIALGVGALQAIVIWTSNARMTRLAQADLRTQSDAQSYLVEVLSGIATLKASGAEERAFAHWKGRFRAQLDASLRRSHAATVVETVLGALHTAAPLALLLWGAHAVTSGSTSVGTMLAVNALAASFLAPLRSLLSSAQNLQIVGAHFERIADVLQAEREQRADGGRVLESARITIRVERASFRYAPSSPDVLVDVSLEIAPGAKLAIVGPTGSGKSTLGHLLIGLDAPTSGVVRFGGHALAELDLVALRKRLGVVLQDAALFAGTVRENIAFHDPDLPLEAVVEAARLACIDAEIAAMPMGYGTRLSEGGAGLSGGQKQRIALARALARKPDVLVLDEATSHLDAVTEARIEEGLARLGCTRIVIAHRTSTVRDAEEIVVLDRGRIVERGTHDELVASSGLYRALVEASEQDVERVP